MEYAKCYIFLNPVTLYTCTCTMYMNTTYIQYRSDARYKARVKLHAFARGGKRTCTLRQIHVYTQLNGFIQGDKHIFTWRQTRLPYTLHLICTVLVHRTLHNSAHTNRRKQKNGERQKTYTDTVQANIEFLSTFTSSLNGLEIKTSCE